MLAFFPQEKRGSLSYVASILHFSCQHPCLLLAAPSPSLQSWGNYFHQVIRLKPFPINLPLSEISLEINSLYLYSLHMASSRVSFCKALWSRAYKGGKILGLTTFIGNITTSMTCLGSGFYKLCPSSLFQKTGLFCIVQQVLGPFQTHC